MTGKSLSLLTIFLFLASGIAYFFLYFYPWQDRMQQMRNEIPQIESELVMIENTREMIPRLLYQLEESNELLNNINSSIPSNFDFEYVLRKLQNIIYPHASSLSLFIDNSTMFGEFSTLWVTPVTLNFTTSESGLMSILNALHNYDIATRIINYNIFIGSPDFQIDDYGNIIVLDNRALGVTFTIEYLTHIPHITIYNIDSMIDMPWDTDSESYFFDTSYLGDDF